MLNDTIAAVSTPRGKGGVALLRVSGDDAITISGKVFRLPGGKKLEDVDSNTAVYGRIYSPEGYMIDDGIAVIYRAPRSFTGEDTVEITCHGGVLVTETVLTALLSAGARMAMAGEYTRRAFLNGKLGLSAAEALGSLLEAGTQEQLKLSRSGLNGRLSGATDEIYGQLKLILASVFAKIDYPDEDLADMSSDEILAGVRKAAKDVEKLAATYKTGRAVSEGIATVICGRTNAGKSSLYNRIVGYDAAIVTDIEGTTRDVLECTASIGKVTLRLYDTAGLRESGDAVERIGVERARAAMGSAELILAVFDTTHAPDDEDRKTVSELAGMKSAAVIAVMNKCDEAADPEFEELLLSNFGKTIKISAKTGEGMDGLSELIDRMFTDGEIDLTSDAVISNARQNAAVLKCRESLLRAAEALSAGMPIDMCCTDVELAMRAIGEVDGREVSDDVVAEIFSKFCVGK